MERVRAGMLLKRYLDQHQDQEQSAVLAVPEGAFDAQIAAIGAASKLAVDGLELQVSRRRSIDWCPFTECRNARLRRPCDHSNTRFTLTDPESGASVRGAGLLWHLMAEHPAREEFADTERSLIEVLVRGKGPTA